MLKSGLGLCLLLSSVALAARAQPAPGTPDAAALADVPPPAPSASAKGGTTVDGVVVNGKRQPQAKCGPKDKDCIIAVAKAVWDQYPEQTRMYCSQEKMRALAKRDSLRTFFSGNAAPVILDSDYMPSSLEVVCAYGDWKTRQDKAAAPRPADDKPAAEIAP